MKIGICTFQKWHGRAPGSIGSSVIRGNWLVEKWPEAELWTNGAKFDVMIFQKVYKQYLIRDFPGFKILDLCDPDWMQEDMKLLEVAEYVDVITCSTQAIADFIKQVLPNKKVVMIPDRLNLDYFTRRKKHFDPAKSVVWFGYRHNAEKALPHSLQSLVKSNLSLYVVSNKAYTPRMNFGIEIKNIKWVPETAYQSIQLADMALNPSLISEAKAKYKSNNKTLIAWALGLPVADDGDSMRRFLDPKERQKEVDMRWEEIKEKWDIELSVKQFKEILS